MKPLMPKDSISVYTSKRLYVSTNAGAIMLLPDILVLFCANLATCVTIECIKDILQCRVKLSNIHIDNGTVGNGVDGFPLGIVFWLPNNVSIIMPIGRAKYSWFVE